MEAGAFSPVHLSWIDAIARVGLSVVCALAIGVERFIHRKPVDFRPYVIIALSSCALSIAIIDLGYRSTDPHLTIDPAKVVSGVMTGIGFLGAGALFRDEQFVRGAGSAAAIWAAGAIGIVCGLGFLWLALLLAGAIVLLFLVSRDVTDRYGVRAGDEEEGQP
jgi:putative Mg2+ transporter-C (MgtC) family protein